MTGSRRTSRAPRIAVIGAGAFGGWTALALCRKGARVRLYDAWGPGHSRASSGGETRVIRHSYTEPLYVRMAKRALTLWDENQKRWDIQLYRRTGALFLVQPERMSFLQAASAHLEQATVDHELLNPEQLAERYPVIQPDGIAQAILEPGAGYLMARQACRAVVRALVAEGGEYDRRWVVPGTVSNGELAGVKAAGKPSHQVDSHQADYYVFACGPWLGRLFPDLFEKRIAVSRQEAYFFGTSAEDRCFSPSALPIWADLGERFWYGIPDVHGRGFKIADDSRGPAFDPTDGNRSPSADGIAAARAYLSRRFPKLADAPLIEARVCQYSNTPDEHFILDRHPAAENLWLLGGGSGHGYKHGPALGEMAAAMILGERDTEPLFRLNRFAG